MARVRRVTLCRWCTHCRATTSQTRLNNDDVWRCRMCGKELRPAGAWKDPRAERQQATDGT
jgi:ribosomal protein L37AE/L43A